MFKTRNVILLTACALTSSCGYKSEAWRTSEDAIDVAYFRECKEPTNEQRNWVRLSLEVLETFPNDSEIYRGAALTFMRNDRWICHDEAVDRRAAKALHKAQYFPRWIRSPRVLSVAHRLAPFDDRIVIELGRLAFAAEPVSNETSTDIRPRVRSILASLGPNVAIRWKQQALQEMNGDTPLGTGAAQIAAATHDAGAIRQVAALLHEKLPEEEGKVLRRPENRRIIELAYALGAAGKQANTNLQ